MSQNYSTQAEIDKSLEFLNKVQTPACSGCQRGVDMCKHCPCIGTPDEIEKLMNSGYASKLMICTYSGTKESSRRSENPFTENVIYLTPAKIGKESKTTGIAEAGTCTFLIDDKCSLHDKGLKPIQGKMACCKIERVFIDQDGDEQELEERISILHLWNTQRGRDLIEKWKKEVSFTGLETDPMPEDPFEVFELFLKVMIDKCNHSSNISEKEREELLKERKTIVYDKPY